METNSTITARRTLRAHTNATKVETVHANEIHLTYPDGSMEAWIVPMRGDLYLRAERDPNSEWVEVSPDAMSMEIDRDAV